jgi:hypothetical protein
MIKQTQRQQLSTLLKHAAVALDIPETLYLAAVENYEEVGAWLAAEDSPLRSAFPEIYPQGSFRLGTIVRPITDKDEYDIDLVCLLQLKKQSISQKDLKDRVGARLRNNREYSKIVEEGRRCWTLNFPDRFHMDILPAIPDAEGLEDSILITDQELVRWQHSDPKNYATWFWGRMATATIREKRALAESLKAHIEDVPDWKVRTPLQRAVQLLKRHRDIYFEDDCDDKPASIILTTLAANAYIGQDDVFDTLTYLAETMPHFIELRDGVSWVANPVNDKENFADKWRDHPERREKLLAWLMQLQAECSEAMEKRGLHQITESLGHSFGESIMTKAAASIGADLLSQREAGAMFMNPVSGTLGAAGTIPVRSHKFYGGVGQTETD